MPEVHYGVIQHDGAWTIIGEGLRFGRYPHRSAAVRAAKRLGERSALPFHLHVQDELWRLREEGAGG